MTLLYFGKSIIFHGRPALSQFGLQTRSSDIHWTSPPSVLNSFCTDPFGCLLFILCQYFLLISRNKIYFCIIESIPSAVFILNSHLEASHIVDLDESRAVYGVWKRVHFGIDDVIPTESTLKWAKKAAFRSGEGAAVPMRELNLFFYRVDAVDPSHPPARPSSDVPPIAGSSPTPLLNPPPAQPHHKRCCQTRECLQVQKAWAPNCLKDVLLRCGTSSSWWQDGRSCSVEDTMPGS